MIYLNKNWQLLIWWQWILLLVSIKWYERTHTLILNWARELFSGQNLPTLVLVFGKNGSMKQSACSFRIILSRLSVSPNGSPTSIRAKGLCSGCVEHALKKVKLLYHFDIIIHNIKSLILYGIFYKELVKERNWKIESFFSSYVHDMMSWCTLLFNW